MSGKRIIPNLLALFVTVFIPGNIYGSSPKSNTEYLFSPYYGINYTRETEINATAGAAIFYRAEKDTLRPYSMAGLVASLSSTLAVSGNLFGIHHFKDSRLSLKYDIAYNQMKRDFWGIGYANASYTKKGRYFERSVSGNLQASYSFGNCAAGASIGYRYYHAGEFTDTLFAKSHRPYSFAPKFGVHFTLDTKDEDVFPTKGVFLMIEQDFFPGILSSDKAYYRTTLTFDFYQKAWKGSVFALDIFSQSNYGDTPWNEYCQVGGDTRMRGYYLGRYRDRNLLSMQLELRQIIYRGHSIAVWGGAINVFDSYRNMDIKNTLPTYGAGYRFQIASLILRADAGFGLNGQYSITAGINHTF